MTIINRTTDPRILSIPLKEALIHDLMVYFEGDTQAVNDILIKAMYGGKKPILDELNYEFDTETKEYSIPIEECQRLERFYSKLCEV